MGEQPLLPKPLRWSPRQAVKPLHHCNDAAGAREDKLQQLSGSCLGSDRDTPFPRLRSDRNIPSFLLLVQLVFPRKIFVASPPGCAEQIPHTRSPSTAANPCCCAADNTREWGGRLCGCACCWCWEIGSSGALLLANLGEQKVLDPFPQFHGNHHPGAPLLGGGTQE